MTFNELIHKYKNFQTNARSQNDCYLVIDYQFNNISASVLKWNDEYSAVVYDNTVSPQIIRTNRVDVVDDLLKKAMAV